MSKKDDNDKLVEHIQSELENSLYDIDSATQSKITQARHRALEQRASKNNLQIWLPAGAVVSACVMLLMFLHYPNMQEDVTAPVDDFELISNIDDMELFEEMEFYEWLDEYELPT